MRADFSLLPDADAVKAAMAGRGVAFYGQFTHLKKVGAEWRGPCPLHGGDGPNFVVYSEGNWHCHSQCQDGGDAIDFLCRKEHMDFPEALETLAGYAGITTPAAPSRNGQTSNGNGQSGGKGIKPTRRILDTYNYPDEAGTLLYQPVRYAPKGFSQRRPDPAHPGQWIYNLGDVRRVLYRLPDVLAAVKAGKAVYIVEGEKDADNLAALGLCGTTNAMGAGNWRDEYADSLIGANVVILPDNDEQGKKHAQEVARSLHGKAARVRIVELPGLSDKGDVSDWLDAAGTKDDLIALVKAASDYVPPAEPPPPEAAPLASMPRKPLAARMIDLADIGPPPSELPLLFGPYLLKGATHWLSGQAGLGKSTFAFNLVRALAFGETVWDIPCPVTRILYVDCESGEIGRAYKVKRLFGEDERARGRVFFLPEPPRLPMETMELLAFAQEKQIGLVIFDTARRVFSVKDENDNSEVYSRVVPLLDALKKIGVASLTMGHVSKNGGNGSARGAGAQEDAGDVNLSLVMHKGDVTDADGIIALKVTKNRILGLGTPPLYLRRVGDDHFERLSSDEAGQAKADATEETPTKREQCKRALTEYMETRPNFHASYQEIVDAMKAAGYTEMTTRRAKDELQEAGTLLRAAGGGFNLTDPFS